MESRHSDDALAMRYMQASHEEKQRIADQIAKLPAPKAPRLILWIGVSIALVMLGVINWLLLVDLAYMKPDLRVLALIDVCGLAGIAKAIMYYQVSKPSVYNMLVEYKARHGHLPPK